MQEFDFYIYPKRATLDLYVHKGAELPDLADPNQWQLEGHIWEKELRPQFFAKAGG
jgi:hypothetical protein